MPNFFTIYLTILNFFRRSIRLTVARWHSFTPSDISEKIVESHTRISFSFSAIPQETGVDFDDRVHENEDSFIGNLKGKSFC
jgi:hypothetical protein